MKTCKLKYEKKINLEKNEEVLVLFDAAVDLNFGCCIVGWFDNKPLQLASNYVFFDPVDAVHR